MGDTLPRTAPQQARFLAGLNPGLATVDRNPPKAPGAGVPEMERITDKSFGRENQALPERNSPGSSRLTEGENL
jgi:hypothetical protein